jgi:hypothetical protein
LTSIGQAVGKSRSPPQVRARLEAAVGALATVFTVARLGTRLQRIWYGARVDAVRPWYLVGLVVVAVAISLLLDWFRARRRRGSS